MTQSIREKITALLDELKGAGSFAVAGTSPFQYPGLSIENFGELSYPVNAVQIKELIKVAHKAPFGKGSDTVYDDKVRRTWEIDGDQIQFLGKSWENQLQKILKAVKEGMGIEQNNVDASLYKLLIYEKGDFFLPHRDSEKEKGMFGSLVIGLPSRFSGGELTVSFQGEQKLIDFAAGNEDFDLLPYAAFYADCEHEIKPVRSGYRICLVYNLLQLEGQKPAPPMLEKTASGLAKILEKEAARKEQQPMVILLGHQYTPENFSLEALKLNDRPKAEAILQAAKKAGYHARLCLLTSYEMGMPDDDDYYPSRYGRYGREGDVNENATMAEVYESGIEIKHWASEGLPVLKFSTVDEQHLVHTFELNQDDPIEKECSGYMGNYGPDLTYWYHYGAIILWSTALNGVYLIQQRSDIICTWISYFLNNPQVMTPEEEAAIDACLKDGITEDSSHKKAENLNLVADWVIGMNKKDFFNEISADVRAGYLMKIHPEPLAELMKFLGKKQSLSFFGFLGSTAKQKVLIKAIEFIRVIKPSAEFSDLITSLIKQLPEGLSSVCAANKNDNGLVKEALLNGLLWVFENNEVNTGWETKVLDLICHFENDNYRKEMVFNAIMREQFKNSFYLALVKRFTGYLQAMPKPEPPTHWKRDFPSNALSKEWYALLKEFFNDPEEQIFDYQALQSNRKDLEHALRHSDLEVRYETIRKGSPHTLRIIKTSENYKKHLKEWEIAREELQQIKDEGIL